MKPAPNDYHVMRSMDMGEQIYHPWLPKRLAEKLAAVLQEIEDDRRSRAKDKRLREDKAAFDIYYVRREVKRPKTTIPAALKSGSEISICSDCANAHGGVWPKGHVATWHTEWPCQACGKEVAVCALSDWEWPGKKGGKEMRGRREI